MTTSQDHSRDPLHGVKLEDMLVDLVDHYGWKGLSQRIEIQCFINEPSIGSSLKFLRRTPWARQKVETLYLRMKGHLTARGSDLNV
jgi:uncharacterized protein (DUF2132 family)